MGTAVRRIKRSIGEAGEGRFEYIPWLRRERSGVNELLVRRKLYVLYATPLTCAVLCCAVPNSGRGGHLKRSVTHLQTSRNFTCGFDVPKK